MKNKFLNLIILYLGYIFQKSTIIIFSFSLLLIVVFLSISSNMNYNELSYLSNPEIFHQQYFTQSLFIIQIFNSIIIATITITLILNATSFDSLFVSHTPRILICFAKICAFIIILFSIILFEVVVLFIIPTLKYTYYKPNINELKIFIYLFQTELIEFIISIAITTLLSQIFVPMIFMFISIVIKLFSNNLTDFNKAISNILPIINVSQNSFICNAIFLSIIWVILIGFIYIGTYSIKDIKNV